MTVRTLDREAGAELLARKLAPLEVVETFLPSWSAACRDEGGGVGLARGWHITAAGRSGLGKSIFALNLGAHAVRSGISTCFISLEMSRVQLETRLIAIVSGEPVRVLEQGPGFDPARFQAALNAFDAVRSKSGAEFASTEDVHTLEGVVATIREQREVRRCGLFIVDYLQLAAEDPNDAAEITRVSHAVRRTARELGVVTVGVSQFNRLTSASSEQPTIYGLMGASALENDSDQVVLLDHTRIERASAPAEGWNGYALLAKNRHGACCEMPIHFDSRTLRIRELLPDELPAEGVR